MHHGTCNAQANCTIYQAPQASGSQGRQICLPTRKDILTATSRHRATTERVANTAQLQTVAVNLTAACCQHAVVTGVTAAMRGPGIALPVRTDAIDKDIGRALGVGPGWPAAVA